MELIDREELLSEIRPATEFDEKWACTGSTVKKLMIEHINRAPTVDAVPVVRCKDCKHQGVYCKTVDCNMRTIYSCFCVLHGTYHEHGWFCADGERETDEKGT